MHTNANVLDHAALLRTVRTMVVVGDSGSEQQLMFCVSVKGWGGYVASVPGLPRYDLPFVFTIMHGIGRSAKIKMPVFRFRVLF